MLDVVTPAIGRAETARECWPKVRQRAGEEIFWTIVIDPCPNDEDALVQLTALGSEYADRVIVRPERGSNGSAIQQAWVERGKPSTFMKLDADVTPSPRWVFNMQRNMENWQDGKLGAISALPNWVKRSDVGPRRVRQAYGQMVLYSPQGLQAIGDHSAVKVLHGDHDPLTFRSFTKAGLWWCYTHNAWWSFHDERTTKFWHNKIDPYA